MHSSPQKRVIIITYYWPPSGGSGVQRWLKFSKYLTANGWQPVIVAPQDADYELVDHSLLADVGEEVNVLRVPIREPYALYRKLTGSTDRKPAHEASPQPQRNPGLLKRLATYIRANWFVPDPKILWVKPVVHRLKDYLSTHQADVILTTGPPHSVHLVGRQLKHLHPQLRWVMDVRDPWSQFDVHLSFGPGQRARSKNKRLEQACLRDADLVMGTAYSMPDHLEPFDEDKYVTLTNGFDGADFPDASKAAPSTAKHADVFRMMHTGLLSAARNPVKLWQALSDYLATRDASTTPRLEVHLIGQVDDRVKASIASFPKLAACCTFEPWLPHAEIIERYAEADLFLLCPNRSDNAKGQINGKLFEYLAAGKPILHIGPYDADNTRILDATHAGLTVPPNDLDGMRESLRLFIGGTFQGNAHALRPSERMRFERSYLASQLAGHLNKLVQQVPTAS